MLYHKPQLLLTVKLRQITAPYGTTKGSSQLLPTWQFRSNLRGDSLRGSCGRRGSSGLLDLVHTSGRLGHDTGLSCPVLPVFEHFVSTQ